MGEWGEHTLLSLQSGSQGSAPLSSETLLFSLVWEATEGFTPGAGCAAWEGQMKAKGDVRRLPPPQPLPAGPSHG